MILTKIISRISFIVLFLVFLTSCATTANYEKILRTWVGSHADSLVTSWGPPHNSYELSTGGAVLEYSEQRNVKANIFKPDSSEITVSCTTRFTVNSRGIITHWQWIGNGCKALPPK